MHTFIARLLLCVLVSSLSLGVAEAQWTIAWNSSGIDANSVSGWISFQQNGSVWTNRFYILDSLQFRIMESAYSEIAQYTYNFSPAERLANNTIYSLGLDLTGDGIVEFYVLSNYGSSSPYRQSFKILNIVNNTTVFERYDPAYSYSYPVIWDVNGDGRYDCSLLRYDYPSETNYRCEVYDTGVSAGARDGSAIPTQVDLHQNFPNPFNPNTRIEYQLSAPGRVQLDIYNMLGQRVKSLVDSPQLPGDHSVNWDGISDDGKPASSGAYFYRLELNSKPVVVKQMILVK
jgi:hypothetical protein